MRNFALGLCAGAAIAIGLAGPTFERGDGTGSTRRHGDYEYEWLRISFTRGNFEIHWWPS